MVNYQQGKIYKIQHENLVYVGGTTQKLRQRRGEHRRCFREQTDRKCSSRLVLQENYDAPITLLENYPCNSKEELDAREQYWIDQHPECVNRHKAFTGIPAGLTHAEYNYAWWKQNRERLADKEKESSARRYQANREAILAHQAEQITCGCGSTHRRNNKSIHLRSAKHLRWAEAQP